MTSLQRLELVGAPNSLVEIPDSIAGLTSLVDLKLHGCHEVKVREYYIGLYIAAICTGALAFLTRLNLGMDCDSAELVAALQPSNPVHKPAGCVKLHNFTFPPIDNSGCACPMLLL